MGHSLDVGLALRHLLFLLEYCMVTGYDWWDILLHVQPGMVQSLVEKLHEEYTRQKAELQQVPAHPLLPPGPSSSLWVRWPTFLPSQPGRARLRAWLHLPLRVSGGLCSCVKNSDLEF